MSNPLAIWSVRIDTECPKCGEEFNMLDDPDFWEGKSTWELCEHGTPKTTNVRTYCTKCDHHFHVDLEY